MKYTFKVLKIVLLTAIGIFIILNLLNIFFPWQYYPSPEKEGPLPDLRTAREKKFCDSLLQHGYYDVELRVLHIIDSEGQIKMPHWLFYKKQKPISCEQEDSINYNNAQLLAQLITFYVEDSIIFENEFYINYRDVNDDNNEFMKRDRNEICGFDVVKIGKNRFKRIYNRPRTSGIQPFIPDNWIGKTSLCLSPD
ncbi:MAG: hypothetical protein ACK5B9_08625 [Flavobacteriia bacterium]|jgi:hypothetical protein